MLLGGMKRLTEKVTEKLASQETIESLSMEQIWRRKLTQIARLLEEHRIGAPELVKELYIEDPVAFSFAPRMRYYEALSAMRSLRTDEKTVERYFGSDARRFYVLERLNELRFTLLDKFLAVDEIPSLKQALFVYRLPVSGVLDYYEAHRGTPELLDPMNILAHFYAEIALPYAIASPEVLSDRQALAGYFVTNFYARENEYVIPHIFRFALKNSKNEKEFVALLDQTFTFRCVASGPIKEDLWLFFEATRKE